MRRIAVALGILALSWGADAQVVTRYAPLGYQQISALSSAINLTVPTGARIAEICVEVASVRYRDDGTAPTSSVGVLVAPLSSSIPNCFQYSGGLTAIQFIAVSGSPIIDVAYYR